MRRTEDVYAQLANVSASIPATSELEKKALIRLEGLLVRSHLEETPAELAPRELSVERSTWYAPENLAPERVKRLEEVVSRADLAKPAEFRVFRRESPLTAPALDVAAPAWGRGGEITQSVGPFTALDGRKFWFDFYSLVRLVPLYLAGDLQPALMFFVRQLKLKIGDPIPVQDAIKLLTRKYELAAGSFWIRANLSTPSAPAGTYVGLRATGGDVTITPPPVDVGGKLTIPSGGSCGVNLNLAPPAPPKQPGQSNAGADADAAQLNLPDNFRLTVSGGKAKITKLAGASWAVYGQRNEFSWSEAGAVTYEPQLLSVVVPMRASVTDFTVGGVKSPFAKLEGSGKVQHAGWTLPVATIDVSNPTEAAGSAGSRSKRTQS